MSIRPIHTLSVVTLLLSLALSAPARDLPYGAVSNALLSRCDAEHTRGTLAEARSCYANLLQSDAPLAIRAEAAWAMQDLKAANRFFQDAVKGQPDNLDVLTRWGELFAHSHQNAEAMEIFKEVLATKPGHSFALAGAARVLAQSFSGETTTFLTPLLDASNAAPGAQLRARLLAARMALERADIDAADQHLAVASTLADTHSFNAAHVFALRAALDLRRGQTSSDWVAKALEARPASALAYTEPARNFVMTRRYREAVTWYQRAIELEPQLASAHEALGINLMRINRLSEAREHLETAYELDPYSPITVNTLRLLDSFTRFDVISDPPDAKPGDERLPLHLRLRKDESAAIAPYAIAMTRQAIAVFEKRYGYTLDQPLVVEMYPDHDDFAVRTAGMPGLGILGVAFGYLVAMDSPSGRAVGEFQWGTTLWHELAHVLTLSATNHKVPRWYSEGLSVFEEWQSGPNPGIRIPPSVFEAMAEDKLLPISELDGGFIRPSYPNQVIVSYMQAGLICQYLHEELGDAGLAELLRSFSTDISTADAIEQLLGIAAAEFDARFKIWVDKHHGRTYQSMDAWRGSLATMHSALQTEDYHGAIAAARPTIELYPGYIEADSAWLGMARAERALDKPSDALASFERWIEHGGYDPQGLKDFAALHIEEGNTDDAIRILMRINDVDPLDDSLHVQLGSLLLDADRPAEASNELTIALALEPHDKAQVLYLSARALTALGETDNATERLFQALEIAPNYREAQKLLLQLSRNNH